MSEIDAPHGAERSNAGRDWLIGGGEMGKLVRSMDWSKTQLGAIDTWPQSLRTTVSLCLASNFPISLAWGPQRVQIYNDGYWPMCGAKHPVSMGQDFRECWDLPWPIIGEPFERALRGETRYLENQWMYLDRHGYLEEACVTFSFSPILDESGGVGGIFNPVTEVTAKMVSERRIRALREIMSGAASAHTIEESLTLSAQAMASSNLDLPFAVFYLLSPSGSSGTSGNTGSEARLIAATGPLPDSIAPRLIKLGTVDSHVWPLEEVVATSQWVEVDDLAGRFGRFDCGPYPEAPHKALLLPLVLSGDARPSAVLVAGVSPRLPLDEAYRTYYDLLAGTVAAAATSAHAYQQERRRAESLAEMDRAKTAFFSNVSHEFRTPLTLMLGPIEDELAETAAPLPADRHERLQTAHRNSLRLLKLVNTLLDFSRIEAGRIQARFEATSLNEYTAELASNFRSAVEKGGLSLIVDCPPLPEPVYVDREMWEKIVLNLISNAFKHTFEGSIRVAVRWCSETVELTVTDTGVGIPAAEVPNLFRRFHRVTNAQSRTHEGTGIGLALVQELVQTHGGTIHVESEEGRGSTFTATIKTGTAHLPAESFVSIPSVAAANPDGAKRSGANVYADEALRWIPGTPHPAAGIGRSPGANADSPRPRILWADDNADMRDYVRRLLSDIYDVIAVPDGTTAVEEALASPPDLVLTDVMMPGLDGFGVLNALRSDDRTKPIPVILLSARAGEEASVEGIDAGADDYLMKPFSARELLARIAANLRSARMRQEWMAAIEQREGHLKMTADELTRSNRELQQFAYVASHDLQEPLRMVTSYVQLLSQRYKGKLGTDADEFISFAVDGSFRMKRMIDDLLSYSRAGLKRKPLSKVRVQDALDAALKDLHAAIEESAATVTHDPLPVIFADDTQLIQVFQNLIGNAIKYRSSAPPRIHVSAAGGSGQESIFSVRDNGLGIDPQYFEKIFVLFQRLHGPGEFSGTGIGLATCKKIIERQGGRIWVESKPGQGSTFSFALPAHESSFESLSGAPFAHSSE